MNKIAQNPEVKALLAEIDRHRVQHDMSKTGFGLWAVNDPNLLRDLESGRDLRWRTIKTIRDKMESGGASLAGQGAGKDKHP